MRSTKSRPEGPPCKHVSPETNWSTSFIPWSLADSSQHGIMKFLTSRHSLAVKTRGWKKPKVPKEQRICIKCAINGNDRRALFCPKLPDLSDKLCRKHEEKSKQTNVGKFVINFFCQTTVITREEVADSFCSAKCVKKISKTSKRPYYHRLALVTNPFGVHNSPAFLERGEDWGYCYPAMSHIGFCWAYND